MSATAIRLLVIGDGAPSGVSTAELVATAGVPPFVIARAPNAHDGLERVRTERFSAVVINLVDGDPGRTTVLETLRREAPGLPAIVVGEAPGASDETVAPGAPEAVPLRWRGRTVAPDVAVRDLGIRTPDQALFLEQQLAQITLNAIGDAVISTDARGVLTFLNPAAEAMTGWTGNAAIGRPAGEIFRIVEADTGQPVANPMLAAMATGEVVRLIPGCLLIGRGGQETPIEDSASPIRGRDGAIIGAVLVFKDVSAARALALRVMHLAQHDFLTDLPNRMLLHDRLGRSIAVARRHGHRLAVLFLDLDRFKHVNDSLGHLNGDALLQSVARRLAACVRESDTVSRHGGDEFVILLSEIERPEGAVMTAHKIAAALAAPHEVAGFQLHVGGTIGISIYPEDGSDAVSLIGAADTAMYHAKGSRKPYQFFERTMSGRAVDRLWFEAALQGALERDEFVLHYQPIVDLQTGSMSGAEALIRWVHPERGLMYPRAFMAIAEECGLIVPIGRWVLRQACAQARAWLDAGRGPMSMAVNISAAEFTDPRFLDHVRAALAETRLDPRHLELELTEAALIHDPDAAVAILRTIEVLGVRTAIDDFGTGYSSLSYLRQFPISVLKIDQSFIQEISEERIGTSLVRAVIGMGRMLGHRVIAEGIETREQMTFLQAEASCEGQGFYFSPALPAEQFARLPRTGMGGHAPR